MFRKSCFDGKITFIDNKGLKFHHKFKTNPCCFGRCALKSALFQWKACSQCAENSHNKGTLPTYVHGMLTPT